MSYSVNHTDVANYGGLVVEDKTINNDTSLSLVGRFYPGYSKLISENFVHLLENFASATAPSNPTVGQLWYDTDTLSANPEPKLMMWTGGKWLASGLAIRSSTEPQNSVIGDMWLDLSNMSLNMYNGSGWTKFLTDIDISTGTGVKQVNIVDVLSQPTTDLVNYPFGETIVHPVMVVYASGHAVAIFNWSSDFTPRTWTGIESFNTLVIKAGINIPTVLKFRGTATQADALTNGSGTITSSQIFNKTVENQITKSINIKSDTGLIIDNQAGTKRITIVGDSSGMSISSKNDIIITSNNLTSSTNISVLSSGISLNKPLTVSGTITGNDITGTSSITTVTANISNQLTVNGKVRINSAGTIVPKLSSGAISGDLGSNTAKWGAVYADRINSAIVGDSGTLLYGNLTGTINSHDVLYKNTKFSISGALTTVINTGMVTNYGGVSDTVDINTDLAQDVITQQPAITSLTATDKILVQRSTSLNSASIRDIAPVVIPVGTIMAYANNIAPAGFVYCNGQSLVIADYSALYGIIGTTFGQQSAGSFKVPSLADLTTTDSIHIRYYIYTGVY